MKEKETLKIEKVCKTLGKCAKRLESVQNVNKLCKTISNHAKRWWSIRNQLWELSYKKVIKFADLYNRRQLKSFYRGKGGGDKIHFQELFKPSLKRMGRWLLFWSISACLLRRVLSSKKKLGVEAKKSLMFSSTDFNEIWGSWRKDIVQYLKLLAKTYCLHWKSQIWPPL